MRIQIIGAVILLGSGTAWAAEGPAIGMASIVNGTASVQHADQKGTWVPLRPGAQVHQGDFDKTEDGTVQLTFEDKSSISLASKSQVELNEFVYKANTKRQSVFKLWGGRLRANVSKFFADKSDVRVTTPTAVAGVRGTQFIVSIEDTSGNPSGPGDNKPEQTKTSIIVLEGKVGVKNILENIGKEIGLGAGQSSSVAHNQEPGDANQLSQDELRQAQRIASARSKGTAGNTVGSSQFNATSSDIGGGAQNPLDNGPQFGAPPIDQQPTDANQPSSLTIRVRIPGQQ